MAQATYAQALKRLLAHEGGYSNHPSDPGGPTNFGITIADYRMYVKPGASAADVRAMRIEDAHAIYRAKYWDALRCDELPAGVDYAVFDYGVNSGIGRSGKVLRRILGMPDSTHVVSDAVIQAACAREAASLVSAICDERLAFLKQLRTWPVFGTGWGRRVAEVRAAAQALAKPQAKVKSPATPSSGKGVTPVNAAAQRGTAGATIAAGAAAGHQAHVSGAHPSAVLAVILVALMLAAAAWWFWRRRQRQQQEA